jgi:hypothetical protein
MIPRLAYAAVRTPPMPDRFLKLAEAWGNQVIYKSSHIYLY